MNEVTRLIDIISSDI